VFLDIISQLYLMEKDGGGFTKYNHHIFGVILDYQNVKIKLKSTCKLSDKNKHKCAYVSRD
jgi:hypothetical protein